MDSSLEGGHIPFFPCASTGFLSISRVVIEAKRIPWYKGGIHFSLLHAFLHCREPPNRWNLNFKAQSKPPRSPTRSFSLTDDIRMISSAADRDFRKQVIKRAYFRLITHRFLLPPLLVPLPSLLFSSSSYLASRTRGYLSAVASINSRPRRELEDAQRIQPPLAAHRPWNP
jgi:hypothetical protein